MTGPVHTSSYSMVRRQPWHKDHRIDEVWGSNDNGDSWLMIGMELNSFPKQGENVRLVNAYEEWMVPMLGWKFQVVRNSPHRIAPVRLRADYLQTNGAVLELAIDTLRRDNPARHFILANW